MTSASAPQLRPVCPSLDETTASLALLRPRGRAWRHGAYDALQGSLLGRFLRWMAYGLWRANGRICALLAEMHCSTAQETRDAWMLDHGLPDACDPYADLCAKVRAVGDTTAAYAIAALSRAGFDATIEELHVLHRDTAALGCGGWRLARGRLAAKDGVAWRVTILPGSPGFAGAGPKPFTLGRSRLGKARLGCGFASDAECILRRVMPAHADLILLFP